MAKVPFHYVDLRAFCYATEDEHRVEDALRSLLPEEFPVERADTEGYFGDRILVLSARVENADEIRHVLGRLAELPEFDRIRAELDERVTEDCEFFLRLDKQAAYRGRVELGDGITVRSKVEAYPAKKPLAVENVEETFAEF
jgi:RNA binding exosome subunit